MYSRSRFTRLHEVIPVDINLMCHLCCFYRPTRVPNLTVHCISCRPICQSQRSVRMLIVNCSCFAFVYKYVGAIHLQKTFLVEIEGFLLLSFMRFSAAWYCFTTAVMQVYLFC